jgi:hypothetical protein
MRVSFEMWAGVGKKLGELQSRGARGVSLHLPPGTQAPWLSAVEQNSWKVNFAHGESHFSASGPSAIEAVERALSLCPRPPE